MNHSSFLDLSVNEYLNILRYIAKKTKNLLFKLYSLVLVREFELINYNIIIITIYNKNDLNKPLLSIHSLPKL